MLEELSTYLSAGNYSNPKIMELLSTIRTNMLESGQEYESFRSDNFHFVLNITDDLPSDTIYGKLLLITYISSSHHTSFDSERYISNFAVNENFIRWNDSTGKYSEWHRHFSFTDPNRWLVVKSRIDRNDIHIGDNMIPKSPKLLCQQLKQLIQLRYKQHPDDIPIWYVNAISDFMELFSTLQVDRYHDFNKVVNNWADIQALFDGTTAKHSVAWGDKLIDIVVARISTLHNAVFGDSDENIKDVIIGLFEHAIEDASDN